MANPNPSPLTRFKPGNKGGGRKKGSVRSDDVKRVFGKFWRMTMAELFQTMTDPGTPMGEVMVAAIMLKVVQSGDAARLDSLLDRAIGRVKHAQEESQGDEALSFKLAYKE